MLGYKELISGNYCSLVKQHVEKIMPSSLIIQILSNLLAESWKNSLKYGMIVSVRAHRDARQYCLKKGKYRSQSMKSDPSVKSMKTCAVQELFLKVNFLKRGEAFCHSCQKGLECHIQRNTCNIIDMPSQYKSWRSFKEKGGSVCLQNEQHNR